VKQLFILFHRFLNYTTVIMTTENTPNNNTQSLDEFFDGFREFIRDLNKTKSEEIFTIIGEIDKYTYKQYENKAYFTLYANKVFFDFRIWDTNKIPEDTLNNLSKGKEVKVEGHLQFSTKGDLAYISVNKIEILGDGEQAKQRAKTKKDLENEGLIKADKKEYRIENPYPPNHIGLIAGENSEAYQDIFSQLGNHKFFGTLTFVPSKMQGDTAPESILNAIRLLNEHQNDKGEAVDLIIIARGGGNEEDFRCFDDIELARGIGISKTPVMTALGHASNKFLADETAEYSAVTPSAAIDSIMKEDCKTLYLNELTSINETIRNNISDFFDTREEGLQRQLKNINKLTVEKIARLESNLNKQNETLQRLDPLLNEYKRGYTIITDPSDPKQYAIGKDIVLKTVDYIIKAKIEDIKKKD